MDVKEKLQQEYLNQVNIVLPKLARETGKYPVIHNHCFSRFLLDGLFSQCWYSYLDTTKGPAYKQLSIEQLSTILRWCEEIAKSPELANLMNNNSLRWRKEYT